MYLDETPYGDTDSKDAEQQDNPPAVPGVMAASPLERQQQAGDCREEEDRAE